MSEKRSSRTAISKLKTGAIEIEDKVGKGGIDEATTSDDEPRGDDDGKFEVVDAAESDVDVFKTNDDEAGNMTDDEGNADDGISDVQFLPAEEDCREKRRVWTMYHNVYYEVGVGMGAERVEAGAKRKMPGKTGGSKPKRAKLAAEGDPREARLPNGKL